MLVDLSHMACPALLCSQVYIFIHGMPQPSLGDWALCSTWRTLKACWGKLSGEGTPPRNQPAASLRRCSPPLLSAQHPSSAVSVQGCNTSNEGPHLVLPCTLHALSTSGGEYSLNHFQWLLEEEYRDVAGYEPFSNPGLASRIYYTINTTNSRLFTASEFPEH